LLAVDLSELLGFGYQLSDLRDRGTDRTELREAGAIIGPNNSGDRRLTASGRTPKNDGGPTRWLVASGESMEWAICAKRCRLPDQLRQWFWAHPGCQWNINHTRSL